MTRNSSMRPERMKIQIIVLFQNLGEDDPVLCTEPGTAASGTPAGRTDAPDRGCGGAP